MEEMLKRIKLHSADQVLTDIYIYSITNEYSYVNVSSVNVYRLHFPYNCYSLDLSNNTFVMEKGVKQVFLHFHILANYSLEIVLHDHRLASYREIKAHKFQSAGAEIILDDHGE